MHSTWIQLRLFGFSALIAALALHSPFPVQAQEADVMQRSRTQEELREMGRYQEAMDKAARAVVLTELSLGADHPEVAKRLNDLAGLYKAQGLYSQADRLYKRSLAILEKSLGPAHPLVPTTLNDLAMVHMEQGLYAQAEPLLERSLAMYEKSLGPDHPNVAMGLGNLAGLYKTQGLYSQAERLFKRSLAILEKSLGPDHRAVATALNNLALLQHSLGQYSQAEPLFKRSLAIREKTLGPDHPDLATALNNIAELYQTHGLYAQAEPLFKRALTIVETSLGPDHPNFSSSLKNLAQVYQAQGQHALAEPLYERSLAVLEKSLGPDHPDVARSLGNLAGFFLAQGQHAQAEPLFKRALAIIEKSLGPDHPLLSASLNNLAALYRFQREYAQAEPLLKRSLAIAENSLGADHPVVARSLNNLADLFGAQGNYPQALAHLRRASTIYRQRIAAGGGSDAALGEAFRNQSGFVRHLSTLTRNPGKESAEKIVNEAFQVVQLAQASGTASAIAKMAARFAKGDDELATLIKRKQDASDRAAKAEAALVNAAGKPPQQRNTNDEQRLRDDTVAAGKEIAAADAELTRRFPQYQELTRPEPVTVDQVRNLLKPGEAMLVYALDRGFNFAWVVSAQGAAFFPLLVNYEQIATRVAAVRAQMELDNAGRVQRVDLDTLHQLYRSLFAPIERRLVGVRHLIVVPSGPLQGLPMGMLVASTPPMIERDADYRQVDWLTKRYALSVLPSVSSIQALRQFAGAGLAKEPFAGFGDPAIGNQSGAARGNSTRRHPVDIATAFRSLVAQSGDNATRVAAASEVADVESIRRADSLPETANELRAMAKVLGSGEDSVWLRERATETNVKQLDLSKYRTLAFATHGVIAGQVKGVGEPGLILTPPGRGTLEDDGYLAAGEIAKLKLDADWVILSACNTAASDGTPGAEGLSGMAKAFFYAGARSLLVSHWPVASEATVPLTSTMLKEHAANPTQGKAQAQRKAMLDLMNTPDRSEYAHPLFWAPFVVVGEGG